MTTEPTEQNPNEDVEVEELLEDVSGGHFVGSSDTWAYEPYDYI
jgi:hypothetical protein